MGRNRVTLLRIRNIIGLGEKISVRVFSGSEPEPRGRTRDAERVSFWVE